MKMEFGIKAKEIMESDFPILDSSMSIESCMKKLNNKHEACIVLDKGFIYSVIGYDALLKAFFKRKKKDEQIKNIKSEKFAIIGPETDLFDIIILMTREKREFLIVKDENSVGLITKRGLTEVNPLLFEDLHLIYTP
jgi:predicted transcriptional regulator